MKKPRQREYLVVYSMMVGKPHGKIVVSHRAEAVSIPALLEAFGDLYEKLPVRRLISVTELP